jgi:methionyl-tRNA formyltransferase
MGSPDFAVPSLQALNTHCDVLGVITQPDRPSGRGRSISQPAVKTAAIELGLSVLQPRRLRDPEAIEQLSIWAPDLIVVAAFGQILRAEVLDLPQFGCLNVHASLLPRWRGAAPIQACLIHGDNESGVTIMKMDPGIDTGPILSQKATQLMPAETAGSLTDRLARMGADLLIETLPDYLEGRISPQQQDGSLATYAPMLKKEDGELNFNMPAAALERRVRAFQPWPGAYTRWREQILKIYSATAVLKPENHALIPPGMRFIHHGLPAIGTGQGLLVLDLLQPAGKKVMGGLAFLAGARDWS